jgi:uncharacterized protein (DUF1778 family)
MTSMKDDWLQLRVDAVAKRRLEEAASEARLSVTAFVLQAANRAADDLLAERQTIYLSPCAAAAFTEALNRLARVNERLAKALQRPTKSTGSIKWSSIGQHCLIQSATSEANSPVEKRH